MSKHNRKGQQTERVTINVTPEQRDAVDTALMRYIAYETVVKRKHPEVKIPSENDVLLMMLRSLCSAHDVEWPEHVKQQGKRTDLDTP